jgi:hypothetical protein
VATRVVVISLLLASLYVVSLFLGAQRTPYDRAAGSYVQFNKTLYVKERSIL